MSRMVSRWVSTFKFQPAELQGHMLSNGEIHYTLVRGGRNLGQIIEAEKAEVISRNKMEVVFDNEEQAKEEFELLGFLL